MMTQMGTFSADKEIAAAQFTDEGDAIYRKFVEQMEYAQARGPLPKWPEVSDAISLHTFCTFIHTWKYVYQII